MTFLIFTMLLALAEPIFYISQFTPHNLAEDQKDINAIAEKYDLLQKQHISLSQSLFLKWRGTPLWYQADDTDQNCRKLIKKEDGWKEDSSSDSLIHIQISDTATILDVPSTHNKDPSEKNLYYLSAIDEDKAVFGAQEVRLFTKCSMMKEKLQCNNQSIRYCPTYKLHHSLLLISSNTYIMMGLTSGGASHSCKAPCPKPQPCPKLTEIDERLHRYAFYYVTDKAPIVYRTKEACLKALH